MMLFTPEPSATIQDSPSQNSFVRMRRARCLTVVNRRQKGVFASSQNKTKQVEKIPNEWIFVQTQRQEVLQKSVRTRNGDLEEVIGGFSRTFPRIVNSGVAGA